MSCSGSSQEEKKSTSTNPFEDEQEVESSLSSNEEENNSTSTNPFEEESVDSSQKLSINMASVRQRGALMEGRMDSVPKRGVPPAFEGHIIDTDDLEMCSEAPDSDYASHVQPRSLWQQSTVISEDIRHHANHRSNRGGPARKKRSKVTLWVTLVVTSLLLIGAIVAVSFMVFGGKAKRDPGDGRVDMILTNRQQLLSDIISTVSTPETLADPNSPQSKARKWLLFDDALRLNTEDGESKQKVIQRYSLAVFFHATGGPEEWKANDWLEGDECSGDFWDGINCNDSGEVRTIAFGKSESFFY
jgi:flagellar basal body-associated protein FliL